jgi:hypothetical protein
MPSNRTVLTATGVSSAVGKWPVTYYPDTNIRPFSLSVAVVLNSTANGSTYNVEHSLDYGSSGVTSTTWQSSAATWFQSSGITANSCLASFTAYTYPVSAVRLNSTAGNSSTIFTVTVVQAG